MADIQRGEIWWADLPERRRSEPGFRRPVLVIQANSFNRSRIQTVLVAVVTSNQELAGAPGHVLLSGPVSGLPRDSVVNISQIFTLDRAYLTESELLSSSGDSRDLQTHEEKEMVHNFGACCR